MIDFRVGQIMHGNRRGLCQYRWRHFVPLLVNLAYWAALEASLGRLLPWVIVEVDDRGVKQPVFPPTPGLEPL